MMQFKRIRLSCIAVLCGLAAFICNTHSAGAAASLELYATFHAMGVIVTIDVVSNDRDADNDTLSIESYSPTSANGGTISQQDEINLIFTPPPNFNGTDTFTYKAGDGQDASNTATVTVTVEGTNPGAGDDGDNDGGQASGGGGCFINSLLIKS